jgi:hypothetical protein
MSSGFLRSAVSSASGGGRSTFNGSRPRQSSTQRRARSSAGRRKRKVGDRRSRFVCTSWRGAVAIPRTSSSVKPPGTTPCSRRAAKGNESRTKSPQPRDVSRGHSSPSSCARRPIGSRSCAPCCGPGSCSAATAAGPAAGSAASLSCAIASFGCRGRRASASSRGSSAVTSSRRTPYLASSPRPRGSPAPRCSWAKL